MPISRACLATLLLCCWQVVAAEESRQVGPGDYVRVRAPAILASEAVGTVLVLSADSLVLNQLKSPFYSVRLAIPIPDIAKLERRTASTGRWERQFAVPTGEGVVPLREVPEEPTLSAKSRSFWVNLGLGSTNSMEKTYLIGLSYSVRLRGRHLLSLRAIDSKQSLSKGVGDSFPEQEVREFALLYGRAHHGAVGTAALSIGLAAVSGVRHGEFLRQGSHFSAFGWWSSTTEYDIYKRRPFSTLGIPIDLQLLAVPHPFLGLGIHGFANVNPERPYWGVLVALSLTDLGDGE